MKQTLLMLLCAIAVARPAMAQPAVGRPVAGDQRQSGNEFVAVDIRLEQPAGKAGGHGRIVISLRPKKGIHVNALPPIDLRLAKDGIGELSGKLEYSTVKHDTTQYIDPSKPIKQSFSIAGTLKPGPVSLRGSFTFFYCSDAEGWCSRFKQPIDLKLTIIP
jgi:hypothetical protein